MIGTARVIRGNALALPLADASVDLCVTSPPYFGLRSYQDAGEHYAGQIGSETTPAEFVDALIAATREMVRVLKPSGSIFVNLGDKYASGDGSGNQSSLQGGTPATRANGHARIRRNHGVPTKSLIGIPWRYALRCIDELGLILRAEIIWAKPNGLPESVTDRVRRSHEQWFHFTREPRYFSAVDEIRMPHIRPLTAEQMRANAGGPNSSTIHGSSRGLARGGASPADDGAVWTGSNPLGKLPGSVWTIPTQPLTVPPELGVDHFAAFPMEWPRRIIQGWSPAGVCTACGEPRQAVWQDDGLSTYAQLKAAGELTLGRDVGAISEPGNSGQTKDANGKAVTYKAKARSITGYACGCPAPQIPVTFTEFDFELDEMVTRTEMRRDPTWRNPAPTTPAVILDPFGGTGTTALVAKALGRIGISVDMSADYCRLAAWRCNDPGQMAAALEVERPEPVSPDQLDLFSEVTA